MRSKRRAYSVDKFYRLSRGMKWWPDEQPSPEIKEYVEKQLDEKEIDVVFTHTCPAKYIPTECFLSGIDQSKVDNSTEEWLDTIEYKVNYEAWYLGHWHTDKRIDKLHFLFHGGRHCKTKMPPVTQSTGSRDTYLLTENYYVDLHFSLDKYNGIC